jgi:hypothetical protein
MSGGDSAQGGEANLRPAQKKKTRRIIKSVLHNFLGTYTSRNSDYDGYWLFGFLVLDFRQITVDLLDVSAPRKVTPLRYSHWLAAQKFAEQVALAGLPRAWFREARLEITRSTDARQGIGATGHGFRPVLRYCQGYDLTFTAKTISDLGKTYEAESTLFAAPHNPFLERRSVRRLPFGGFRKLFAVSPDGWTLSHLWKRIKPF